HAILRRRLWGGQGFGGERALLGQYLTGGAIGGSKPPPFPIQLAERALIAVLEVVNQRSLPRRSRGTTRPREHLLVDVGRQRLPVFQTRPLTPEHRRLPI